MQLAISCNSFGAGGGLERYALDITGALSRKTRLPITVYSRRFDAGEVEAAKVEPRRIDVGWLPGKLRDLAYSRRLQRLRRPGELLIACNRVRGADIAVCGGTHRGYLRARGRPARASDRWQIRLEAEQYAGAACVVAHSKMMERELQELYQVPEARIELLYPPVDAHRFAPVDAEARRALRARYGFGDEIVFLFASSGHARKGFDLIAGCFAASPLPVMLAVAGRPVGRSLPRVRELGYSRNIEELYCAADYTILASDYEPFGLVGIESILCGTPLVFADDIGCLEVVDACAVEPFARRTPETLAGALERAVARVRRGEARLADPRAMLRYDPGLELHADALIAACRKVLAGRQALTR